MESKKSLLTRSSYNNRKQCIKKKTMELATLCGIDACTIMHGVDGEIESWPENPAEAKAIIKKFKDLTSNPRKRITVRDESQKKKVIHVPGGEVGSSDQENLTQTVISSKTRKTGKENGEIVDFTKMAGKRSLYWRQSTGYQELLKKLDSKLEDLTEKIEFLRRDQECDMISPKRRKISQVPVMFPFDLNCPPPDEPECSSLSSEDCKL